MKKILLVLTGVCIFGMSFSKASDDPMPFSENPSAIVVQDAPVYPNPARDHIFLNLTNSPVADNSDPVVEIRNILGNKMPLQLERIDQRKYRISLANYPVGYYLLVLQCEQCGSSQKRHEEIHKFLKQ